MQIAPIPDLYLFLEWAPRVGHNQVASVTMRRTS
jgi:hypothetical protein